MERRDKLITEMDFNGFIMPQKPLLNWQSSIFHINRFINFSCVHLTNFHIFRLAFQTHRNHELGPASQATFIE